MATFNLTRAHNGWTASLVWQGREHSATMYTRNLAEQQLARQLLRAGCTHRGVHLAAKLHGNELAELANIAAPVAPAPAAPAQEVTQPAAKPRLPRPPRDPSLITPAAAISDPALFGGAFEGASWDRWRAILRAAYGEPLNDAELKLFREVADRNPPAQQVQELWCIAGRRSGKDSIASAIATVAAMGDYSKHLRPGERACILCLASTREQAQIVFRYVKGYFETIPMLRPLVARETDLALELTNHVEIVVATNSFRAVRGRTVVCAIFDEVAYWRSDESANPDAEIYQAVTPSLATLPGSMLIGISNPYRRSGLLFERWSKHYGQDDPDVLVVRGATPMFNSKIAQRTIDDALERDPEKASAEWLAEWRTDLADFVSREAVEACVIRGRHELPPAPGINYSVFVDPSGGSSDSMTLAISHHGKDGVAVLDALREIRPPFSPEGVVKEFCDLMRSYNVTRVKGDKYGGEWPAERFRENGIAYEPADAAKSDLYRDMLPILNSGKVELLDNSRLVSQLCSLERRTARSGRDSIDHPVGSHDDVCNAAAGALLLAGKHKHAHRYGWTNISHMAR